jgi:RHS repeat-associated protein
VWEKQQPDGSWLNINSLNQDATQKTFTKNSPTIADEGNYRWSMTNTLVTGMTLQSVPIQANQLSALATAPVLYNGLITTARWRTDKAYQVADEGFSGMYLYDYDEKYQLKEALFAKPNFATNSYQLQGNTYRLTGMAYDPNGNIQALKRYGDNGQVKNNFTYTYDLSKNNNQLKSVSGYANNYEYNKIGQMVAVDKTDANEKDQWVDYDVTGKVVAVYQDANKAQPTTKYAYDDRGFRLSKITYKPYATPTSSQVIDKTTWYIRDASGNVLSIYESIELPPVTKAWQYPLDGNMQDGSGNGMQGEVFGGATLATDRNGNMGALQLDGATGFARIADNPQLDFGNKDFTVSIWVKKLQPTINWSSPVAVGRWNVGSEPGTNSWVITLCNGPNNDLPSFYVEIGQVAYSVSATTSLSTGQWYQLSASKIGNQLSISVNGALQGTTTIPSTNVTINTTSLPLYVGRGEATGISYAVFDDLQMTVQLTPSTHDTPVQKEIPIYGSGKIGTYYPASSVAADQSKTDAGSTAYEITDHLGNVRALLRVQANEYTATMEDDGTAAYTNPRVSENVYFKNLFQTEKRDVNMNHTSSAITPSPNTSSYLYWIDGQAGMTADKKSVGPAIALSVSPGDQIDLSAWARFKIKNSYTKAPIKSIIANVLAGQYAFSNGLESITQAASNFNLGLTGLVSTNEGDTDRPYAYLNYIVFNDQYIKVNAGAQRVPLEAGFEEPQRGSGYTQNNLVKFTDPITISQAGYVYVWVSNESENTEVWFDDVSVIHHKPLVAQATDYESWGGVLREQKWIDMDAKYRYGYQGKYAERDDETGWDHFELREYDPDLGRWLVPDPKRVGFSPYIGMGNNPITSTDPDGGKPNDIIRRVNGVEVERIVTPDKFDIVIDEWKFAKGSPFADFTSINIVDKIFFSSFQLSKEEYAAQYNKYWPKATGQADFDAGGQLLVGEAVGMGLKGIGAAISAVRGMTQKTAAAEGAYLVYQGVDASTGAVQYIGITSRDVAIRSAEHMLDPVKAHLTFIPIKGMQGLSKEAARVAEQRLINYYGLQRNGGVLLNRINSIAPSKWSRYGIE